MQHAGSVIRVLCGIDVGKRLHFRHHIRQRCLAAIIVRRLNGGAIHHNHLHALFCQIKQGFRAVQRQLLLPQHNRLITRLLQRAGFGIIVHAVRRQEIRAEVVVGIAVILQGR